MCFVEKVKEPYEISSMLVQTLGFRAECDIAALHFPRGKIYKGKGKAFNHRASTIFTGSVLVCTLSSCHAVFSSFQVCHAPACCPLFVHHSWSFLRDGSDQGPQVLNGVTDRARACEWGVFLFLWNGNVSFPAVLSSVSLPRSAVAVVTQNRSVSEIRD